MGRLFFAAGGLTRLGHAQSVIDHVLNRLVDNRAIPSGGGVLSIAGRHDLACDEPDRGKKDHLGFWVVGAVRGGCGGLK